MVEGIAIRYSFLRIVKRAIAVEIIGFILLGVIFAGNELRQGEAAFSASGQAATAEQDYIKWVDFTVSYEALCRAYAWDVDTHGTTHEVDWIELLAYTAAKTGGEFDNKALSVLEKAAEALSEGESSIEELTGDLKYYSYYHEAYDAVLGGMVGEYEEEMEDENGEMKYQSRYGLKAYFPLARGFDYSHYDDFGVGRSYGYKRKHLGHDMMGLTGTPIRIINGIRIQFQGCHRQGRISL